MKRSEHTKRANSTLWPRLRAVTVLITSALLLAEIGSGWANTDPATEEGSSVETTSDPTPSPFETEEGISSAAGGGGNINNEVVVRNFVDGRFANRTGFGEAHVTGNTAMNQNAAAAVSSCSDCRTVAVAVQLVLVQSFDPTEVSPRNVAIAMNQGCSGCETFATAHQYVLTTGGLVRFSPEGRQRIADLVGQVRSLAANDTMPFPQLDAEIGALVDQMWSTVDNELVKVGRPVRGTEYEDTDIAIDDSSLSPTPSPSEFVTESPSPELSADATEPASPSSSPSPKPSESGTEEPSPEPSPSSSPSPSPSN